MNKHFLKWKPVVCRNVRNEDFCSRFPATLAKVYKGKLISEILQMPRKNPISFDFAISLINDKCVLAVQARNASQYLWYYDNFVSHISDLGYHIELTGDEFEFVLPVHESN